MLIFDNKVAKSPICLHKNLPLLKKSSTIIIAVYNNNSKKVI